MNEPLTIENQSIDLPAAGPVTDDQVWGMDAQPVAGNAMDVTCQVHQTPCPAWDGQNRQCLSSVCVFDLQVFAEDAA